MYTKRTKLIGVILAVIMLMQVVCTSMTSVVQAVVGENEKGITFVDENLYKAILETLKNSSIKIKKYDDKSKTITMAYDEISKVTKLNLSMKEITNLSGLSNFGQLEELNLTSNKLKNIDELKKLTNITTLSLSNNNIEDCKALKDLAKLNVTDLTIGSQDLRKVAVINKSDIQEEDGIKSFTYALPHIFKYIYDMKKEKDETVEMISNVNSTEGTGLSDPRQYKVYFDETDDSMKLKVTVKEEGMAELEFKYTSGTGLDTKLTLNLFAVMDEERQGIVFEDQNLYYAVKDNIEGTENNGYIDSKYPKIRDDNTGCIWYDDILTLVINKHYLYKEITNLELSQKRIQNLEGLQYFVALSDLNLSNNYISDVVVLKEFANKKTDAEAELKNFVKEKYDNLIEHLVKKEKCLELKDLEGRRNSAQKIVDELKTYVGSLTEEDNGVDDGEKEILRTYFLDKLDVNTLINDTNDVLTDDTFRVDNFINNSYAVIGTNKIDSTTYNIEAKIDKANSIMRFKGYIQNSGSTETYNEYVTLNSDVINEIIDRFEYIRSIKQGNCIIDGDIIDINNEVSEIEDAIQELKKYYDITNLLLILPKENVEYLEDEIDNLNLSELNTLASNIVRIFKEKREKLTNEEILVASIPEKVDIAEIYKKITDEENANYIGDNKDELINIIKEYINYQKNISYEKNILYGIGENNQRKILSNKIMDYTASEVSSLSYEHAKELALTIIDSYIKAYENNQITSYAIEIAKIKTKEAMEADRKNINDATNSGYTSSGFSGITTIINDYRNYQTIFEKELLNYTNTDFNNLSEESVRTLLLTVISAFINEYDSLSEEQTKFSTTATVTKAAITDEYNGIIDITSSYDTKAELVAIVLKYIGYQKSLNDLYSVNFNTVKSNYTNYITEAVKEISPNYYGDDTAYDADRSDVNKIIERIKQVKLEEVVSLPKTKRINLASNNLVDISGLSDIKTLLELNVSDNIIKDLTTTDFAQFEKLYNLDLSHNRIYNANIGLIPNIRILNLSNNYISNTSDIKVQLYDKLQKIDLSSNRIYDLEDIMNKLHEVASKQTEEPIIEWTNSSLIVAPWVKIKDMGYVIDKSKVNFENQTIYANAINTLEIDNEEYIYLPAIFNQVKYITSGITNFKNAKSTNDGIILYLDTSKIGEQTNYAVIEGSGFAVGTTCYVNYNVVNKGEVEQAQPTGVEVQKNKILDENACMPDLDGNGIIDDQDFILLNKHIRGTIVLTDAQKKLADVIPDTIIDNDDYLLLEKYASIWNKNTLTPEEKTEIGNKADLNADGKIDNADLIQLGLKINDNEATGTLADFNKDGKTDETDAMLLSKYITSISTEMEEVKRVDLESPIEGEERPYVKVSGTVKPSNANQTIKWTVRDPNVVEIESEEDGKVKIKSLKSGDTFIYATSEADSRIYATIPVFVSEPKDKVTGIKIKEGTIPNTEYYKGTDLNLTGAKLIITYRIGDEQEIDIKDNADVEVSGYQKDVEGKQNVIIKYTDKETNSQAQTKLEIEVFAEDSTDTVEKIDLLTKPTKLEYNKGEDLDLTGATVEKIMTSGRKQTPVAVIPEMISGYDSAVAGKQTVTVTYEGKTAKFEVMVNNPVTAVILDKTEESITKGGTIKLNATVSPEDAVNKNVTWSSSDASIATVDSSGNVTAVDVGEAIITVTTVDGEKTAECKVIVKDNIYEIGAGYIANISPSTSEAEFLDKLNSNKNCKVVKSDGVTVLATNEKIATGYKLVKTDDYGTVVSEISTLVVKGDINGDGDVDGTDATAIIYHINGKKEITDKISLIAADVDLKDGIDMTDYTRIIYHYIGIRGYIL